MPVQYRTYMKAYLRASDYKNIYQNSPYSVIDFLGDYGGIVSIVMMFCTVIISSLVQHLYETSIISETYQV